MIAGQVYYKNEDGALIEYKEGADGTEETREIFDAEYNGLPMVKANDAYLLSMEVKMDDMAGDEIDAGFPLEQHIVKVIACSAKLDDFEGALRVINDAAEKFPEDPDVLYWQARIYETRGDIAEAARIYESVVNTENGAGFSDAYNALGDIYLDKDFADRSPQKALEYLEKGLETAPDNFKIIISIGKAYREIGKTEESNEYLALGQSLYKINSEAKMGAPQEQAIEEFGEPEENFPMTTEYQGQEIEVDVAKFTFEDVIFYVQFYDGSSMGWSRARPTGSGE
jgi:tetratricopeptide (TPR) repeat protein